MADLALVPSAPVCGATTEPYRLTWTCTLPPHDAQTSHLFTVCNPQPTHPTTERPHQ